MARSSCLAAAGVLLTMLAGMGLASPAPAAAAPNFTTTLGPEQQQAYPSPAPYQAPDSAFPVVEGPDGTAIMFWSDGSTFRTLGSLPLAPGGPLPAGTPSPLTPVLSNTNVSSAYDYNGDWLLAAFPLPDGRLVGFTHVENHFPGSKVYGEWNGGAVAYSVNWGANWTKAGLAVYDPQPSTGRFGGTGYSSILPHPDGGFIAYGGCSAFRSLDPAGAPGTWLRWHNGSFSTPGVNGSSADCLPGVPANACCPIAHWNAALGAFVMVYTTWADDTTLFVAASTDGLAWGPSSVLLAEEAPYTIAYGQVIGATNSSAVGPDGAGTLVYARAPPTGGKPRDFVRRAITFTRLP